MFSYKRKMNKQLKTKTIRVRELLSIDGEIFVVAGRREPPATDRLDCRCFECLAAG